MTGETSPWRIKERFWKNLFLGCLLAVGTVKDFLRTTMERIPALLTSPLWAGVRA